MAFTLGEIQAAFEYYHKSQKELYTLIEQSAAEKEKYQAQINMLSNEINNQETKVGINKSELRRRQKNIDHLEKEHADISKKIKETNIKKIKMTALGLENQLDLANNFIQKMEDKIIEIKAALETSLAQHNNNIERRANMQTYLNKELDAYNEVKQKIAIMREKENLQLKIKELNESVSTSKADRYTLNEEKDEVETRIKKLHFAHDVLLTELKKSYDNMKIHNHIKSAREELVLLKEMRKKNIKYLENLISIAAEQGIATDIQHRIQSTLDEEKNRLSTAITQLNEIENEAEIFEKEYGGMDILQIKQKQLNNLLMDVGLDKASYLDKKDAIEQQTASLKNAENEMLVQLKDQYMNFKKYKNIEIKENMEDLNITQLRQKENIKYLENGINSIDEKIDSSSLNNERLSENILRLSKDLLDEKNKKSTVEKQLQAAQTMIENQNKLLHEQHSIKKMINKEKKLQLEKKLHTDNEILSLVKLKEKKQQLSEKFTSMADSISSTHKKRNQITNNFKELLRDIKSKPTIAYLVNHINIQEKNILRDIDDQLKLTSVQHNKEAVKKSRQLLFYCYIMKEHCYDAAKLDSWKKNFDQLDKHINKSKSLKYVNDAKMTVSHLSMFNASNKHPHQDEKFVDQPQKPAKNIRH